MGAVVEPAARPLQGRGPEVPFVDVINTMLDATLPLTVGEFEEWGNPKARPQYGYMRAYCPYDNLEREAYPAMLVRTSLQRQPGHVLGAGQVRGEAARRSRPTRTRCCCKTNMDAGHGGASGRYDACGRSRSTTRSCCGRWGSGSSLGRPCSPSPLAG